MATSTASSTIRTRRHQEAVDAGEHGDGEQVAHAHDADRRGGKQRQKDEVDQGFDGGASFGSSSGSRRSAQHRLDAGVERGAGNGVGGDRPGQNQKKSEQEEQLDGDQRQARRRTIRPTRIRPAPKVSETEAACRRVKTSGMRMRPSAPTTMKTPPARTRPPPSHVAEQIEAHVLLLLVAGMRRAAP